MQAAAEQAHADRVAAVAEEERRQQMLQDQLVMARVAGRLGLAQKESQAELDAVRADCDRQLSRTQAEHVVRMDVVNADLQQTQAALNEVLDWILTACVNDCSFWSHFTRVLHTTALCVHGSKNARTQHCLEMCQMQGISVCVFQCCPCARVLFSSAVHVRRL